MKNALKIITFLKRLNLLSFSIVFSLSLSCVHYLKKTDSLAPEKTSLKIIRDLSFFPMNGERFRLSELEKKVKAVVIFMRERNCPISEKYGSRIAHLEKQYSKKGIKFIYNYVGQVKRDESAIDDLKRFGFKEPYVIDSKQIVLTALNAKTTGDVFILSPERKIVYRGPVDDQYHLLRSALRAKNNYVSDILDAIVSGKNIEPKELPAPGCIINRPVIKKKLFWSDVAPIIQKKCTICHNPSSSGFINYINYKDVSKRKAMFKYVVENDLMPPWSVDPNTGPWENDLSLTPKEKAMLLKWVDDGCLKKKKQIEPLWAKSALKSTEESYIIRLPEKVEIPAEGFNEYKHYVIRTNFKEDKWIKRVDFFLKPKVMHHAFLVFMDEKTSSHNPEDVLDMGFHNIFQNAESIFGASATQMDKKAGFFHSEEIGYKLPRSSIAFLQVHYESIGQKVIDEKTHFRIHFHKKKPKYKSVAITLSADTINIPPQKSNIKISQSLKVQRDMNLLAVRSHMHLRGKASSIYVVYPNGEKERIFGIDPYFSIFERKYEMKKPLVLVKGSILKCIIWYDNSSKNVVNPDPTQYVTKGPYLKDEMGNCYFSIIFPVDTEAKFQWL